MLKDKKYLCGRIYAVAGDGEAGISEDGTDASQARLNGPAGLAIDSQDNVYIAEIHNHVIRKIDRRTNLIATVAGCGESGFDGDKRSGNRC